MVTFPFCKINLGLRVVRKRPDGYHDIETVFYPVPWCDVLEIIPAQDVVFASTGIVVDGATEDNLCMKAYRILSRHVALPPVHIHLHKTIPTGAGLGGGSSDAAHMLLLLNERFGCNLGVGELFKYAAALGSDCPFFLHRSPMYGTGRGDLLSPADITLSNRFLVLVKPMVHVSTAEAYAEIVPAVPAEPLLHTLANRPMNKWHEFIRNDFEGPVFKRYPEIGNVKEKMYEHGAVYAAMTGSGSAVFGIFEQPVELQNIFHGMTYWSGTLSF